MDDPQGILEEFAERAVVNESAMYEEHIYSSPFHTNRLGFNRYTNHGNDNLVPEKRKLTDEQVRKIRSGKFAKKALAREFGVAKCVIYAVLEGRTYREVR